MDRRRIQVPRAGNSLCFSETEMDCDVEIDLKLDTTSIGREDRLGGGGGGSSSNDGGASTTSATEHSGARRAV
ncbi:hypothetical protein KR032_008107 [Drosophila birchii]|nr:hypothetical protein KR032_008107 [Drosophila birchii]